MGLALARRVLSQARRVPLGGGRSTSPHRRRSPGAGAVGVGQLRRHSRKPVPVLALLALTVAAWGCAPAATTAPSGQTPSSAPPTASAPPSSAQSSAAPGGSPKRIVIATPSPGFHDLPVRIAAERGFFRDEGLDVEYTTMRPDLAINGMLAGEVDYTVAIGSSVVAILAGTPLMVFYGMAVKPLHTINVAPGLQRFEDLQGKAIATNTNTDTTAQIVHLLAPRYGLTPLVDLSLLPLGPVSNRVAALEAQQVGAAVLDTTYSPQAERDGFKQVLNVAEVLDLPLSGYAATAANLRSNPEVAERVIRATLRAVQFMKGDPDESVTFLARALNIPVPDAQLAYKQGLSSFSDDGTITEEGLMLFIDAARRVGAAGEATPAQLADFSLVRALGSRTTR
jgi:ABC-type nitrate/sulfonate/bicarbonate transport system substrate-binding protein